MTGDWINWQGVLTTGNVSIAPYVTTPASNLEVYQQLQQLAALQQGRSAMIYGDKVLVVCGPETVSCKDLDEAQAKAEELAHKLAQSAYILKPVRKVAPKRDVVTTELP